MMLERICGASLLAAQPSSLRSRAAAFKPATPLGRFQQQRRHALPGDEDATRPSSEDESLKKKFFTAPPPQRPTPPPQMASQPVAPMQPPPQRPQPPPQQPTAPAPQQPGNPTAQQAPRAAAPTAPAPAPGAAPKATASKRRPNQKKAGDKAVKAPAPAAAPAPLLAPTPISALDVVNPLLLGRKARKTVSDLWERLSGLSSPTKSFVFDDEVENAPEERSDDTLQSASCLVLVVGATGRVGRVLVRKLLLRGYKVRALVRRREGVREGVDEEGTVAGIPVTVDIVEGDVGSMDDCQEAVKGVDKIIYCAGARSTFTGDLLRVEERGVGNITKALQDEHHRQSKRSENPAPERSKREIADFTRFYHQNRWDVTYVGVPEEDRAAAARGTAEGGAAGGIAAVAAARAASAAAGRGYNTAIAEINEENMLIFEGLLMQRGAIAEVGAAVSPVLRRGDSRLGGTDGITMRVRGDGKPYVCILKTSDNVRYGCRFLTTKGYSNVRLPFTSFRPEGPNQPPFAPETLTNMSIRFDNRRSLQAAQAARMTRGGLGPDGQPEDPAVAAKREAEEGKFSLEIDWIKALPGGVEPDVVLVSCAGQPRPELSEEDLAKVVQFKRRGEELLRLSGLGYTIIRPGTLTEEPGGYKALVFDQGGRIAQPIAAADVADIALRAMQEPAARSKTFEVCYEYDAEAVAAASEGGDVQAAEAMYELVAHVPGNRNNYLRAAVGSLQRNT